MKCVNLLSNQVVNLRKKLHLSNTFIKTLTIAMQFQLTDCNLYVNIRFFHKELLLSNFCQKKELLWEIVAFQLKSGRASIFEKEKRPLYVHFYPASL